MRIRGALTLLLLALVLPATAVAYSPQQLDRWTRIADQAWPWSHCTNRLAVDVVPQLAPDPGSTGTTVLGRAYIGDPDCRMRIVSNQDDYTACVVIVHEAGHVAGLEHQPGGIMAAILDEVLHRRRYVPCLPDVEPRLRRGDALEWVEARWGRHMQTLDCRRDQRVSRQRCWGTSAGGRRLRWTVWRGGDHRVRGGRWK